MTDLKNVSSNDIPVGRRPTFEEVFHKWCKTENPVTKSVYRDILIKRFINTIDSFPLDDDLKNVELNDDIWYEAFKNELDFA